MSRVRLNPVLGGELRQRMRSRWTPAVVALYLLLLTAILQIVYSAADRQARQPWGAGAAATTSSGRVIFQALLFFVLLLLCFVVPGMTAASIAGERDRQTLVPLQLTLLRPRGILIGKLLASLAFVLLLVVATLPLFGAAVIAGGVDMLEALRGVLMIVASAVTLACLSLACSALFRRVQVATVASYALTLVLLVGTFAVWGAQRLADRSPAPASPLALLPNPLLATADVLDGRQGPQLFATPFEPLQDIIDEHARTKAAQARAGGLRRVVTPEGGVAVDLVPAGPVIVDDPVVDDRTRRGRPRPDGLPFWAGSLLTWAALCALSLVLAARGVRVPRAAA